MTEPIRGAGQPSWPLSPYQIAVSYGISGAPGAAGATGAPNAAAIASAGTITRGGGADWFGPLDPLKPIAPPEVAGRRFDFPPGYNLVTRPRAYEPIGFAELRGFADAYDLLRLVIETRKDQMERQRWCIRPRTPLPALARVRTGAARGRGGNSATAGADADTPARIAALEAFWKKPDGVTRWKTWLRALLEDMFVIDAATLYCQRTRAGQLCALHQLDGATIKRVIDDWGRTPQPYAAVDGTTLYPPAYQQVLKGLPAVDYATRDIIYRPRNVRAHRVYGYSPVQQVLMTVNIALRRQLWQLDYFSEGSIPDALIGVPAGWTPDQIRQFQDYWDTEFAGDLAKRRRAKFVPGESAVRVHQTKEPEHKQDFDEWLARIICYAFSVPPQWAVKLMNRATADNQSAQAEDEGLEPTKEWVKDLVDEVIAEEFDSPDLELMWLDEDSGAAQIEAQFEARVKIGAATLNELRDALGLDPFANPAADRPMVLTPTGYVPIDAGAGGNASASPGGGGQGVDAQAAPAVQKYSPDQPRVPKGSAHGGEWTSEDGSGSSPDSMARPVAEEHPSSGRGTQYAALETNVVSDADGGEWMSEDSNGSSPDSMARPVADEHPSSERGPQYAALTTNVVSDADEGAPHGQPDDGATSDGEPERGPQLAVQDSPDVTEGASHSQPQRPNDGGTGAAESGSKVEDGAPTTASGYLFNQAAPTFNIPTYDTANAALLLPGSPFDVAAPPVGYRQTITYSLPDNSQYIAGVTVVNDDSGFWHTLASWLNGGNPINVSFQATVQTANGTYTTEVFTISSQLPYGGWVAVPWKEFGPIQGPATVSITATNSGPAITAVIVGANRIKPVPGQGQ